MVQLAAVSFSWTKMVMMVMAMMAAAEVRAACVGAKWGRNPSSVGWLCRRADNEHGWRVMRECGFSVCVRVPVAKFEAETADSETG